MSRPIVVQKLSLERSENGRIKRLSVTLLPGSVRAYVGDVLKDEADGTSWTVTKTRDVEVIAQFSTAGGKLKHMP